MATIDESGGPGDPLAAPKLGTPTGWAKAVRDYLVTLRGDVDALGGGAPGVPLSLVDAKGDLLVGSGPDAVTRLPVGANGHVLTADSSATNGVRWAPLTP